MSRLILVIDDDRHIVHILKRRLESLGFSVITARNGSQGVEMARNHRPDLIVSDFQMPICNGYEMAVELHRDEQTSDIPILMLTARGHKLSPSELIKTNIQAVMAKPFSARELIATVNEMLGMNAEVEQGPGDHA